MCVIIVQPAGKKIPDPLKTLKYAAENNPDGWGVAVLAPPTEENPEGIVNITRGWTPEALIACYENVKEFPLIIHCRIGTSGKKNIENTHPFPVTSGPNPVWMVHNGVMGKYCITPYDYCDSYHFARLVGKTITDVPWKKEKFDKGFAVWPTEDVNAIIRGEVKLELSTRRSIDFQEWIKDMGGHGNKFVFFDRDGWNIVNKDAGIEKEGCWFSNSSAFSGRVITTTEHHGSGYPGRGYQRENWNYNSRERYWKNADKKDVYAYSLLENTVACSQSWGQHPIFGSITIYTPLRERPLKRAEQFKERDDAIDLAVSALIKMCPEPNVDNIGRWIENCPIAFVAEVIASTMNTFIPPAQETFSPISRNQARQILKKSKGYTGLPVNAKQWAMSAMMDVHRNFVLSVEGYSAEAESIINDAIESFVKPREDAKKAEESLFMPMEENAASPLDLGVALPVTSAKDTILAGLLEAEQVSADHLSEEEERYFEEYGIMC